MKIRPNKPKSILVALFFVGAGVGFSQGTEPQELTKLRESWNEARETALREIDKKYHESLTALQERYTKAGDLDSALKTRDEIESLKATYTGESAAASPEQRKDAMIGKITGGSSWRKLRLGVDSTLNRPGRTWSVIPPELEGYSFSTYSVRAIQAIEIEVKRAGKVRIAVLDRSKTPLERGGWIRAGLSLVSTVNGEYQVWERVVKGDVTLPKPDNEHGYIVIRK